MIPIVTAATLCAQVAPEPSAAEKALRERVTQFYQLQVEKKFRQAEAYIAADTRDLFYNASKPEIGSFTIVKIAMHDNDTRAEVTVKAPVPVFVMGKGMVPTELPTTGTWKIEDGQWVLYVDQSAGIKTPFGTMKPTAMPAAGDAPVGDLASKVKSVDVNAVLAGVSIDTRSVVLEAGVKEGRAIVTNSMPGDVELMLLANPDPQVAISLDKTHLKAGEKAELMFSRKGSSTSEGKAGVLVQPLELRLDVRYQVR